MSDQPKSRREKLEEFLKQNPDDAFTRYGIALECMRAGDSDAADAHFRHLIEHNGDYVPAYQMYAQLLTQKERVEEAKAILKRGIAAAERVSNAHARSEMEGHLAELG